MIDPDYQMNPYAVEYLNYLTRMAELCAKYHVRFVTITTPCHPSYVDHTSADGIKNIYAIVDEVAKLYPIEYINYLDDPDFRSDSLYYDCSHLNYLGSDKFSLRLKSDLGL